MASRTLKCKVCKKEYTQKSNVQRYCSKRCKNTKRNNKRRSFPRTQECEYCKELYWQNKSNQRVCSDRCYTYLYRREHPRVHAFSENKRKHLKKATGDGSVTFEAWEKIKNSCGNICLACGDGDIEITMDHIIPLSKGGTHTVDNIQPLCRSCNSKKKNFHSTDYRGLDVTTNDNGITGSLGDGSTQTA